MLLNIDDRFKDFLALIKKYAKSFNCRIFIVGGAVRDYYLNLPVKDLDLILEGNAIDFSSTLPPEIKVKSVHKDFGTVKLCFNNLEFDLASTRKEKYPYSGCLPVVDKICVPIETDVLRRDFTVNSMYFEILDNGEFELIDLKGGLEDIKNKKLTVLHENSYIDDPTRIFRGLAFKHRFNFDFSDNDKKLIDSYLDNIDYSNMSIDRLVNVFKKNLEYPFGLVSFKEIIEKRYYKAITPKDIDVDFELIKNIIAEFELNYSDFSNLCEKIILSNPIDITVSDNILDNYKLFSKLSKPELAYYFYLAKSKQIQDFLKVKDIKLNIAGADLLKLGYEQGKLIGEIMDAILEYKLNNPLKALTLEDEINLVKTLFPIK